MSYDNDMDFFATMDLFMSRSTLLILILSSVLGCGADQNLFQDVTHELGVDFTQIPGEHELILHAVDLMKDANGEICVLTDRTQSPSGAGYALENRTVMSRVFPSMFRDSHAHRLAPFFQKLRSKLTSLSPNQDDPRVVILTPGEHNESYFEPN